MFETVEAEKECSLDMRAPRPPPSRGWAGGDIVKIELRAGSIELFDVDTGEFSKSLDPGSYDGFIVQAEYPDGRSPEWIVIHFHDLQGRWVWAGLPTAEWFQRRRELGDKLSIKLKNGVEYHDEKLENT